MILFYKYLITLHPAYLHCHGYLKEVISMIPSVGVNEENKDIWLIVLASGFSRRMGEPKLLLPWGHETLIRSFVKKLFNVRCTGIKVVLNTQQPLLKNELLDLPVEIVWNDVSYLGLSSSIRAGINSLPTKVAATVILLADQPHLDPSVVNLVIERYYASHAIIVQASYQGSPGHPVLFHKSCFHELKKITGDTGAREIIKKHKQSCELVNVSTPPLQDIDTENDYLRLTTEIDE